MTSLSCGTTIRFGISPEVDCQMGCNGSACWQNCAPISGQFVAHLTIDGAPARVDLTLSRDGAAILIETAEPAYKDVYPDGPECGDACRQASPDDTIPKPTDGPL